jgi:DNA-binding response OmpR family regulator
MQLERPTVLLVEDDPIICEVVRELLDLAGYSVEWATDGAAGLERLAAGGVDLVLLDLMLPDVDGLELCRRVRATEDDVYLPIIMLTAAAGQGQRHAGFEAGADDYLTKPFEAAELIDRVRVWVRTRRRLRTEHERLLTQQARLREFEHRALREQLAQDQAVLAMARTASQELTQPLTLLLGILELWESGRYSPQSHPDLREQLGAAADELAARVDLLGRVVRSEPTQLAGVRVLDLRRAQAPSPTGSC